MPTKGLVVSKQSQQNKEVEEDHDLEGSSVDGPPSNNHQEIASLVNRMIEEQDLPENDAVPLSLPRSLRDQAPRLHQEDFEAFYRVKEKQEHLEASKIPPVQILALYMRSFFNVLEYDLDTVQHLRDRYIGFFGNILADILELCYPQLLTTNYAVSQIAVNELCYIAKKAHHAYILLFLQDERVLADLRRHHQGKK